jgi:hypothetical protein
MTNTVKESIEFLRDLINRYTVKWDGCVLSPYLSSEVNNIITSYGVLTKI